MYIVLIRVLTKGVAYLVYYDTMGEAAHTIDRDLLFAKTQSTNIRPTTETNSFNVITPLNTYIHLLVQTYVAVFMQN